MIDLHIALHKVFTRGKNPYILVGSFWVIGLFLGGFIAYRADPSVIIMMRTATDSSMSLAGLLLMFCFPALLSIAVARKFSAYLILPLAFLKALCLGFAICLCDNAFGSAGWLVRCLLLFSDTASAFCLICLWLRLFSASVIPMKQTIKHLAVLSCGIFCFEHFIVSPFVVSLFQ